MLSTFSPDEIERARHSVDPAECYLHLVKERVGWFLDYEGLQTDREDELIAAGTLALTKAVRRPSFNDCKYPKAYLRKSINNAIRAWSQEDHILRPSARTQGRWRGQGKKFLHQKSIEAHCADYDVLDLPLRGGDPHKLSGPVAKPTGEHVLVVECYRFMYSLCRDDNDRAVLEARWDGQYLRPAPHVRTIAKQTGLTMVEVRERLTRLCSRYCAKLDLKMPAGKIRD